MKNKKLILGQNLQRLLKEKNLKQSSVSKSLKINNSTFHNYLYDVLPSGIIGISKLAAFFDMSIEELLYGEESQQKCATHLIENPSTKLITEFLHNTQFTISFKTKTFNNENINEQNTLE